MSNSLPSVFNKALGKQIVCRVSEYLPSVFSLALGKEMVCRVSDKIHSAKNMTLGKAFDSGSVDWIQCDKKLAPYNKIDHI